MTIELGGNIKLIGFKEIEPAKLIVIKKVVGNYAKQISEKIGEIQELAVEMQDTEVKSTLKYQDKTLESKDKDKNLFFCLDKALAKIKEQI